jgi:hypothetical protein
MVEDYLGHYPVVHHMIVLRGLGNMVVQREDLHCLDCVEMGMNRLSKKYLLVTRIKTSIWTMQIVGTATILSVEISSICIPLKTVLH